MFGFYSYNIKGMIQKIKAPITVISVFNHVKRFTKPLILKWDGNLYKIKNIGLHHSSRVGKTLYHVYSVTSDNLFFKIVLNTDSLSWELEEISDGECE